MFKKSIACAALIGGLLLPLSATAVSMPNSGWQAGVTAPYFIDLEEVGIGAEIGGRWRNQGGHSFFGLEGFVIGAEHTEGAVTMDLDVTTVMASYRHHVALGRSSSGLTGYVGGGAGFSRFKIDAIRSSRRDSSRDDDVFTWNFSAGVQTSLTRSLYARAGYKYIRFNDVRLFGINDSFDDHVAEVAVGFRF